MYRKADSLFHASLDRARKVNIPHNLTIEWILARLKEPCPKTGKVFELTNTGSSYSNRHPCTPSIDKINPSLGYTQDNCTIVCWWYNLTKWRYTDEEVYDFCQSVVNSYATQTVRTVVPPTP